jgi:antitoxin ParD1/3/4
MTTLNISLPESLRDFVESQAAACGFGTASEYVRALIRQAQERQGEEELEARLLAALAQKPEEMKEEDWSRLRTRVRQVADETRRP